MAAPIRIGKRLIGGASSSGQASKSVPYRRRRGQRGDARPVARVVAVGRRSAVMSGGSHGASFHCWRSAPNGSVDPPRSCLNPMNLARFGKRTIAGSWKPANTTLLAVASILAENPGAVFRLGPERDLEHRALSVLCHDTLPPNGHSAHERSFLVRTPSDDELQAAERPSRPSRKRSVSAICSLRPRWQRRAWAERSSRTRTAGRPNRLSGNPGRGRIAELAGVAFLGGPALRPHRQDRETTKIGNKLTRTSNRQISA